VTIEGSTLDEVQERGRDHLEEQHYVAFERVFVDQTRGKACFEGGGYTFPAESEDIGFECPNCGHDNFPAFAASPIWWRAEFE
jgi:hypothetical protein